MFRCLHIYINHIFQFKINLLNKKKRYRNLHFIPNNLIMASHFNDMFILRNTIIDIPNPRHVLFLSFLTD